MKATSPTCATAAAVPSASAPTRASRTGASGVLITRGSRGMALFEPDRPTLHIPIFGTDQIADVTGAGDTVIATLAAGLGCGLNLLDAARISHLAAGLVVEHIGTTAISKDLLLSSLRTSKG